MKISVWLSLLAAVGFAACSPGARSKNQVSYTPATENTLLWRISGNGLAKPSYLFGTMHMICANDIGVSDSLKHAISQADKVYLELDMDDMMGMMLSAMTKMTMRGDTTLSDLLSPEEYSKVKTFFEDKSGGLMPFSVVEKFKPLLVGSMVVEQMQSCENMIVMEQLVMTEAGKHKKEIEGLETIDFQLGIFDKIPYKIQAMQLLKMVEESGKGGEDGEMKILTDAYRNQELNKMHELTVNEKSIEGFTDVLLYDRNEDWTQKLKGLMSKNALVIAVGAGHLPGERGVINLLRKAGYKVEPVKNDMIITKKAEEI
ncbi:MAG: TraB/GumN family protein [Flavisolibacter sp.]